ncbi:ligand-binding sensor domain-containing diguanylate cyclase [Geothrix terrae]|uniref:ligand-binding sensor domain-containing diguanylate cyclase n=1 Tax=Geothrix terrae TaxID=2922720 RepID=UPI001FAC4456|nr:ligand-binding sensor domain-containing diguanylate cyclase [Geothrix terrae]
MRLLLHLARLLLLASLALGAPAAGLPVSGRMVFRSYGPAEGLEHTSLSTIAQDAEGFLWVGTEGGAYRFDGAGFRLWSLPEGLPSAWVRAFGPNEDGSLWIGTRAGLCLLRQDKIQTLDSADPLARAQIHQILRDTQGGVWVAAESGLFQSEDGGPHFKPAAGWPGGPAYSLGLDGETLWVGGSSVLHQRGGDGTWQTWAAREGVPAEPVKALVKTRSGTLWVRTPSQLRVLAPKAARLTLPALGLPPLGVSFYEESLCPDGDGGVFVPTAKGLLHFTDRSWRILDESRGLPSGWANQAFVDSAGNLWVASLGLHRLLGHGAWENFTRLDGLPADNIWGLLRDRSGVLWIDTSGGLARMEAKGPAPIPAAAGLVLYALRESPDGSIWGGGEHPFLIRISPDRSRLTRIPLPPSKAPALPVALAFDRHGDLWVGTSHDGLWRVSDPAGHPEFHRVEIPGTATEDAITALHEDAQGRLWAATGQGLARRDGDTWRSWGGDIGLRPAPLAALAPLPDGTAWVAYREPMGLTLVDLRGEAPRVVRHWTRKEGLASDSVYSLATDAAGRLWVGGPRGVQWVEGTEHRLFRREDGLTSTDCNPFSTWVDSDGSVWFGSTAGLLHHSPERRFQAQNPPSTLFVSFRLGDRQWNHPFAGPVDLGPVPYGNRTLAAHFTSLTFEHEGRIRFQSRLTGLDEGWVDIPTQDLRYQALPPGPYRLEVRALLDDGTAGPVAAVTFLVLHPWWLRWWAWPVWGGLAVCAGLMAFRWRLRLLEKRNEELKVLVYQRTEALELSNLALATISTTDPLTGLRNRRYLEEELPPVIALVLRAQRDHLAAEHSPGETCLVFAMIDLDHFKRVNDTWSHAAGDLALKQVADVLRHEARESDFLIRWGGEEILFVGHTADLDGAATVVARLHQAIREHAFNLGLPQPIQITCSIGFSLFPFQSDHLEAASWEDQVRVADRCLYAAKRSGRDGWVGVAAHPGLPEGLAQRFDQGPALCAQAGAVELRHSPREGDLVWH